MPWTDPSGREWMVYLFYGGQPGMASSGTLPPARRLSDDELYIEFQNPFNAAVRARTSYTGTARTEDELAGNDLLAHWQRLPQKFRRG